MILQTEMFAQTVIDSAKFYNKIKDQERIFAEAEKIEDSLRVEFYKQPHFIDMYFEKNRQNIQLNKDFEFWIEKDNERFNPKFIENNKFLIDSVSDTITLAFRYELDTLKFPNIRHKWMRNGAVLKFGSIENLEKIRKYYQKHKRDEDFNKWIVLGQPYLRLVENKKLKNQKRKIRTIDFVVITPRVYGDGAIMEIVTIKPRNDKNYP